MSELKKKDNESLLQYRARLYRDKINIGLNNREIYELYIRETGDTIAESSCRCSATTYNQALEDALESIAKDNGSEALQELEDKRMELEKEKIKLQDQKREYKNLYRPQARFENLLEVLDKRITDVNEIYPFKFINSPISESNNEAILIVSDWHISSKFNHYFGKYDLDIAKERIQDLLNKTIEYCTMNKVNVLHLEMLGDLISGGIHWGSKVNSEEDCVSQVMTLCELLSDFVYELSLNIPSIKIYSVIGNHSRINMSKTDNQQGENLERLVPFYLKSRLKDLENVYIDEKANIDDGIVKFEVKNESIIGVHGDLDRPTSVVDNMIKMLRIIPSEIHMGHLHHHYEKEEYDIEVVMNGSLQGTDYYAKDIRKSGRPMQKLMIYNDEGKLCTYKIKL